MKTQDQTEHTMTKPSEALAAIVDHCPETNEPQGILCILGKEAGSPGVTILTRGETTAWRHTIITDEVDPSGINGVREPSRFTYTEQDLKELRSCLVSNGMRISSALACFCNEARPLGMPWIEFAERIKFDSRFPEAHFAEYATMQRVDISEIGPQIAALQNPHD